MTKTYDRRKTFATPLEWLRWALERPGARIAKTKDGHICMVEVRGQEQIVSYSVKHASNGTGVVGLSDCPLTAVEDEHGVIEEPVKNDPLVRAFKLAFSPALSDHDRERMAAAIRDEASRIADERIAAATVEWHGPHGNWAVDHNCRLKPKGDA